MSSSIAITQGEPAGVGPDVIVHLAQQAWSVPLVVIGDPDVLLERAKQLNLPLELEAYSKRKAKPLPEKKLYCHPFHFPAPVKAGILSIKNVQKMMNGLYYAAEGCLSGEFQALVTAPVHKGIINEAGIAFSGHTELFARIANVPRVVMMLMTSRMKVALVTTHLPLWQVPTMLTSTALKETILILHQDLKRYFDIEKPRIAVCGLNPHAGEGGHLGQEEIQIMIPVLTELRAQGLDLVGPLPADTIFAEEADVILAMYHDQGLPLVKYSDFYEAVNVTLGLPFIRTSVDHGTALSLAGTGKAHPGSMIAATQLALTLSSK